MPVVVGWWCEDGNIREGVPANKAAELVVGTMRVLLLLVVVNQGCGWTPGKSGCPPNPNEAAAVGKNI